MVQRLTPEKLQKIHEKKHQQATEVAMDYARELASHRDHRNIISYYYCSRSDFVRQCRGYINDWLTDEDFRLNRMPPLIFEQDHTDAFLVNYRAEEFARHFCTHLPSLLRSNPSYALKAYTMYIDIRIRADDKDRSVATYRSTAYIHDALGRILRTTDSSKSGKSS